MSVFYDNHGRNGDYDTNGLSDDPPRARWGAFGSRRPPPRPRPEREDAPLWGLSYERAEGVIQLVLAFALVGGATAVLSSSLFGAPPARAPVKAAALSTPAPLPPPAAAARPSQPAPVSAPNASANAPAMQVQSAPAAPARIVPAQAAPSQVAPAPAAPSRTASVPASFFDARPIAERVSMEPEEAPRPLAPPSPEAREKLLAQSAPPAPARTEVPAVEAPPAEAKAAPARPAGAETGAGSGRLTKCYLKLGGKPHENSDCRIRQSDKEVVFQFADKTLTFVHERGRAWTATMGGRSFGTVYQNPNKPCWGTRGSNFFACDNT